MKTTTQQQEMSTTTRIYSPAPRNIPPETNQHTVQDFDWAAVTSGLRGIPRPGHISSSLEQTSTPPVLATPQPRFLPFSVPWAQEPEPQDVSPPWPNMLSLEPQNSMSLEAALGTPDFGSKDSFPPPPEGYPQHYPDGSPTIPLGYQSSYGLYQPVVQLRRFLTPSPGPEVLQQLVDLDDVLQPVRENDKMLENWFEDLSASTKAPNNATFSNQDDQSFEIEEMGLEALQQRIGTNSSNVVENMPLESLAQRMDHDHDSLGHDSLDKPSTSQGVFRLPPISQFDFNQHLLRNRLQQSTYSLPPQPGLNALSTEAYKRLQGSLATSMSPIQPTHNLPPEYSSPQSVVQPLQPMANPPPQPVAQVAAAPPPGKKAKAKDKDKPASKKNRNPHATQIPGSGARKMPKQEAEEGHEGPVCSHCSSIATPLWRRGPDDELLCNACGLYLKLHNKPRPKDFGKQFVARGAFAEAVASGKPPQCHNCEAVSTPMWRKDVNGNLACNACSLYYKLHHVQRPISLSRKQHSRQNGAFAQRRKSTNGNGQTDATGDSSSDDRPSKKVKVEDEAKIFTLPPT